MPTGTITQDTKSGTISEITASGEVEEIQLTGSVSQSTLSGTIVEETLTGEIETGLILNVDDYVPYVGSIKDTDLGDYDLTATELTADAITLNGVRRTTWGTNATWGDITGTLSDQLDLQSALDGKEDTLTYTPENTANKDTATTLGTSDTKYPSQNAVKTYVDTIVSELDLEQNESFTLTSTDISNKYVEIVGTITDNQSVLVIVSDIGLIAEVGVDYSLSGNFVYWTGYSFATKLEEGEKLKIYYK